MKVTCNVFAHVKLAVVGGGSGGLAVASKFSRILGPGKVAIVEPRIDHYYQPGFTLVGGGFAPISNYIKPQGSMIPKGAEWIHTSVESFDPDNNKLNLKHKEPLTYDYMVLATGVELRYDMIDGATEGLNEPGIASIYHANYASKANQEIEDFKGGVAIFTFPNTPIKCAGAPQKICYIAEDRWRKKGIRDKTQVIYNTSLPRIFGVEAYANALMKVVESRGIDLCTRSNLIAVDAKNKIATFELLDEGKTIEKKFDFLHIGPPCSPIEPLRNLAKTGNKMVDAGGWMNVDPETLQNLGYKNVFCIGDGLNTGNAKTCAAISSQFKVLRHNLVSVMEGKPMTYKYDGYASCPIVVSTNRAILAEFGPNGPLETFPINQARPLYFSFWMKRYFMAFLYWNFLVKGTWNGPRTLRNILHLGLNKY